MRKCVPLALIGASLFVVDGCRRRQVEPDYQLTATVKDLMGSMVDPIADVLWNSVATVVSGTGTEERAPQTDGEWATVRHSAIILMEATNLLRMNGRLVARPGEKSENPNIELEPEQIQSLIEQDRAAWNRLARALHDASADALKAIEARNVPALMDAGEKIDVACESCHVKYWYPNEKIPELPADFESVSPSSPPIARGLATSRGGLRPLESAGWNRP
jgi:hypothetical protein